MSCLSGGPEIITDGLVLHLDAANVKSYPGTNTTWRDLSGTSITGSLVNGPTFSSANSGVITFDGTNDFIDLGPNYRYQDQYTVECLVRWANTPTQTGAGCGVYGPIFTNKDYGWNMFTNSSNQIRWEVYNTISARNSVTAVSSYLNRWVHIAGYKNGTTIGLFVNGALISTATLTSNATYYDTNNNCTVAGNHPCGGTTYYFGMNMAVAKIYNRALSATEVLQNYNETKTRFGLT